MKVTVIKIGGVASGELSFSFFEKIKELQANGNHCLIVHGGGCFVSEYLEQQNIPLTTKNGLRVTSSQVLEAAKTVLLSQVQPAIVADLQKNQLASLGLSPTTEQLIVGAYLDQSNLGFVGKVTEVNVQFLQKIMKKGVIPVLSSFAVSKEGQWLNVNADHLASSVAAAFHADQLLLLTDVPGIKVDHQWVPKLVTTELPELVENQTIKGGMIPKIQSAIHALENQVKQVVITNNLQKKGTIIQSVEVGL